MTEAELALVREVARLRAESRRLAARLAAAEGEVAGLRTALQWYADECSMPDTAIAALAKPSTGGGTPRPPAVAGIVPICRSERDGIRMGRRLRS